MSNENQPQGYICNREECDGEPCFKPEHQPAPAANPACCVPAPKTAPAPEPKPAKPSTKDVWTAKAKAYRKGDVIPTFPSKVARTAFVKGMLTFHRAWAYRALVVIFKYQTADEQASGTTTLLNGVGFTGVDAELLTSFATQYLVKKERFPDQPARLSPKQEKHLFKKMPKYAGQIIDVMVLQGTLPEIVKGKKGAS